MVHIARARTKGESSTQKGTGVCLRGPRLTGEEEQTRTKYDTHVWKLHDKTHYIAC